MLFEGIRAFCHPDRREFYRMRRLDSVVGDNQGLNKSQAKRSRESKGKGDDSMERRIAALEANLSPALSSDRPPLGRGPVVQCAMGREIYPFIQGHILKSPYIVACVYHVTNRLILNDLATREGVCILTMPLAQYGAGPSVNTAEGGGSNVNVMSPSGCGSGSVRPEWARVRPIGGSGPVRYIRYDPSNNTHGLVALMHHKFIIGLSRDRDPQWVITGSFNFTRPAAEVHDENVVYTDEPQVVARFFAEFNRLYDASVP